MSTLRAWVDPAIHERHPDYATAVVVAAGLRNGPSDADSERRLAAAAAGLRARDLTRAADDAHLAAWRQAFSAFGAKPSKYPCSAEALAARVLKGQPLALYRSTRRLMRGISIRHLLPVGGEDSDRLDGPLRLVIAEGDEPFDPRGDGAAVEHAAPGEVIWRDDRGVTCRRWNWRGAPGALAGRACVPVDLLRVSVGCEHVDDLWADLERALAATRTRASAAAR